MRTSYNYMPEEKSLEIKKGEEASEPSPEKQATESEPREVFPTAAKEVRIEVGQEQADGKYNEILSKVVVPTPGSAPSDDAVALDATSIGATVDEESKIQKLLDLASAKGVEHAVRVARSLEDYYALDRMHDELADKLYDGLLVRGLIRKD